MKPLAPITWAPEALEDLAQALEEAGSGAAAGRLGEGIEAALAAVLLFPAQGRPGRLLGTREQLMSPLPFVLIYRFMGGRLEVVRLYHSSRQWPPAKPKSPKPKA